LAVGNWNGDCAQRLAQQIKISAAEKKALRRPGESFMS
jgi:hypothetical protein